jgi:hypothetical protein
MGASAVAIAPPRRNYFEEPLEVLLFAELPVAVVVEPVVVEPAPLPLPLLPLLLSLLLLLLLLLLPLLLPL